MLIIWLMFEYKIDIYVFTKYIKLLFVRYYILLKYVLSIQLIIIIRIKNDFGFSSNTLKI